MQNVFIPAHFTSYRILKRKHSRVFQQSFNNSKAKIFSHIIDIISTVVTGIPPTHREPELDQAVSKVQDM